MLEHTEKVILLGTVGFENSIRSAFLICTPCISVPSWLWDQDHIGPSTTPAVCESPRTVPRVCQDCRTRRMPYAQPGVAPEKKTKKMLLCCRLNLHGSKHCFCHRVAPNYITESHFPEHGSLKAAPCHNRNPL